MSDSYTFTVGKLDAGMAILIGERASLIEFPSLLLPQDVASGSIVNISVSRNLNEERRKKDDFAQLQHDILQSFGRDLPSPPALRLRNVTQTSVTLEWDKLSLASSELLSLDIYRSDRWNPIARRLAAIPNPRSNTSTKLSGLDVDAEYGFHLVLHTTAGTFTSTSVKVKTHRMTDTHGIAVCFGHIADAALERGARACLERMGARASEKIQIDTTHFVCDDTRNRGDASQNAVQGAMYTKACQLSIPVVQPHWVFACAEQKRMVPISSFYLDQEPPNGSAVRDSISRTSESEASVTQEAALPPTPGTASTEPVTPGSIPNIDASSSVPELPILERTSVGAVETGEEEAVETGEEEAPPPADKDEKGPAVPEHDEHERLPTSASLGSDMDDVSLAETSSDAPAESEVDLS